MESSKIIPMKKKNWFYLLDFKNGKLMKFNEKTGEFIDVGYKNKIGYIIFQLERKATKLHRFLYEQFHCVKLTNKQQIDHLDRNKANNCIDNLRIATNKENAQNRDKTKNNTTGFKGISKHGKNFRARIGINGKMEYLGIYKTPEDAYEAYKKRAIEANKQGAMFHY